MYIQSPQVGLRIHLAALTHFWQDLGKLDQIHQCWKNVPSRSTVEDRKARGGSTSRASFECLWRLRASRPQCGPLVSLNLAKGEKLLAKGGKGHKGAQGHWTFRAYFKDLQGLWVDLWQDLQSPVLQRSDKKWQSPIQWQSSCLALLFGIGSSLTQRVSDNPRSKMTAIVCCCIAESWRHSALLLGTLYGGTGIAFYEPCSGRDW